MSEFKITYKSKLHQLFCRHEFHEGELGPQEFLNLDGKWVTTICIKCGKVKDKRFIPDPWCTLTVSQISSLNKKNGKRGEIDE